jgi:hypothetical protein
MEQVSIESCVKDCLLDFDNSDITKIIAGLFRQRRSIEGQIDLKDHTNFQLIKDSYLGFQQVEFDGMYGISKEILKKLDVPDIISLYSGIQNLKADTSLIGFPFKTVIKELIDYGYTVGEDGRPNALRKMKNSKGVFSNIDNSPIEDRMNDISNKSQVEFLLSFNNKKFYSQEQINPYEIFDEVYDLYHRKNRQSIDSNDARDLYVKTFIDLITKKSKNDENFNHPNIKGWIVDSSSKESDKYLVKRNVSHQSNKTTFNCSCPHGFPQMVGLPYGTKGDECKHIKKEINKNIQLTFK